MLLICSRIKYKVMHINDFYIFTVIMQSYSCEKNLAFGRKLRLHEIKH